jgi:hypothetical protein
MQKVRRTEAADAGYSEIIVAALLGHGVAAGVTARYIHPDRAPLHQAADVTSATIAAARRSTRCPFGSLDSAPLL